MKDYTIITFDKNNKKVSLKCGLFESLSIASWNLKHNKTKISSISVINNKTDELIYLYENGKIKTYNIL